MVFQARGRHRAAQGWQHGSNAPAKQQQHSSSNHGRSYRSGTIVPFWNGTTVLERDDRSTAMTHCSCSTAMTHCGTAMTHCSTAMAHCSTAMPHCSTAMIHCSTAMPHCSIAMTHCSTAMIHCSTSGFFFICTFDFLQALQKNMISGNLECDFNSQGYHFRFESVAAANSTIFSLNLASIIP